MKVNNLTNIAYEAHKVALNWWTLKSPWWFKTLIKMWLDDFHAPEDFKVWFENIYWEIGILMSWWLDSIACYLMAKKTNKKVKCFYYDIWQPYKEKELKAIYSIVDKEELTIVSDFKLKSKGEKYDWWDFILPLRNMIFLLDVAERIYWWEVYFWVVEWELKEHWCWDKGKQFVELMTELLRTFPFPVELKTPLVNMTKWEIVKWYLDNWYKKELHLTMSCLNKEEGHCWKCQSCLKKYLSFLYNWEELKTNSDVRLLTDLIKMYSERTADNNVGEKYVKEMRESIKLL